MAKKDINFFDGVSGYIQNEINRQIGDKAIANLFKFIGNDQIIYDENKFDYINKGYKSVGAIYEAVSLITDKLVSTPWLIKKRKSTQKEKQYKHLLKSDNPADRFRALSMKEEVYEETENASLSNLLSQPNKLQTWDDFLRMVSILFLVNGNAFIYKNAGDKRSNKPTELWALPFNTQQMKIISGGIMKPIEGYTASYGDLTMDFTPEEIIHIKEVNPVWNTDGSWLYGMSRLQPYIPEIIGDRAAQDAANKMTKNGGAFGILSPKNKEDQFTPEQRESFLSALRDAKLSNEEMKRIFMNSVALDWIQIGLPMQDLQIFESKKVAREDIYRAYKVPLIYASNDNSTYNNLSTAGRQLVYNAIDPVADIISKALTREVAFYFDKDLIIDADTSSLPEMANNMKEVSDWAEKQVKIGVITRNETREVLGFGRKDDAGMDELMVQGNWYKLRSVSDGTVVYGNNNQQQDGINNNNNG